MEGVVRTIGKLAEKDKASTLFAHSHMS